MVFLDYANIEAGARSAGYDVDYGALLEYLANDKEGRVLQEAYAYVPIDPRIEHAQDKIIEYLWGFGYSVRSKVGTIAGESYKCDFDVEMTLDIVRISFDIKPDVVVIASGDSDFIPVVHELRDKGIRVEIASFDNSMSGLLARRCSGYINLDSWLGEDSYSGDSEEYEDGRYFDDGTESESETSNRQEKI